MHTIAYTSLFRIVNKFHQEVFSDPTIPNSLNRSIDFWAVTLEHDRLLTNLSSGVGKALRTGFGPLRYTPPASSASSFLPFSSCLLSGSKMGFNGALNLKPMTRSSSQGAPRLSSRLHTFCTRWCVKP
ncbi:hypothetical protein F5148DRAFT_1235129 [Russula earlei]|uniref:Uncharacterized protein n=1 Tax=Russula earlei TaxID=71964 RepID=A0ACC0TXL7_9AGAM|nr:hypothetical protein F5148DRAFT_1235129 [Russula earlei]